MKKMALVLVLMLLAGFVFAQNAVIRELTGTVEVGSGGSFAPARVGEQLREDTVISTGFRSSAIVEVGSALLAVRPLTRLTLTEIRASAGNETVNVNLQAGRVRVDLNPPPGVRSSMSVTGPSTTASVRGTSFEFDTRSINVEYGAVNFRGNRRQEYVVHGGAVSSVGNNGMALDPVILGRSALSPLRPAGTSPGSIGGGVGIGSGPGPGPNPGPDNPIGPSRPPSWPSGPSGPGGGDDGGAGIEVDFLPP